MNLFSLARLKFVFFLAVLFGFSFGLILGVSLETSAETGEKVGSFDHVSKNEIKLMGNNVIIQLDDKKVEWSEFENTNSMDPLLDEGYNGLEFVPRNVEDIHVGDVISFNYGDDIYVHRVVEINEDGLGWFALTKGDNLYNIDKGKRRFKDIKGVIFGVVF